MKVKESVDWDRLSYAAATKNAGISAAWSSRSVGSSALCCCLPRRQAEKSATKGNMTCWKGMLRHGGRTTVNWTSHRPTSPAPRQEVSKLGLLRAWNERAGYSWAEPLVTTEIQMSKLYAWIPNTCLKSKSSWGKKIPTRSSQVNVSRKDLSPQSQTEKLLLP